MDWLSDCGDYAPFAAGDALDWCALAAAAGREPPLRWGIHGGAAGCVVQFVLPHNRIARRCVWFLGDGFTRDEVVSRRPFADLPFPPAAEPGRDRQPPLPAINP